MLDEGEQDLKVCCHYINTKTINWCMSSRREVLIRMLAVLQRKTLLETKKLHIEMFKTALFDCAIAEKCCSGDGGHGIIMPSFFVPTLPDLIAQESPPLGIWHPRQKNANAQESAQGGRGRMGWAQLEMAG